MNDMPNSIAAWRFVPDKADEWLHGGWSEDHDHKTTAYVRADRLTALEAENAALREALRPFAKEAGWWFERNCNSSDRVVEDFDDYNGEMTCGDLFRARAALSSTAHPADAGLSVEAREDIVDTIEEIISETHDIDVTDRNYAENVVGWLERHHPAALRAIAEGAA